MKLKRLYNPILILFAKMVYTIFGFDFMCNILLFSTKTSVNHNKLIIEEFGGKVGEGSFIYSPLLIHNANGSFRNLRIGNKCHIGKDVFFDLADKIIIHDHAVIAMRTTLLTHIDVAESPLNKSGYKKQTGSVVIGSGAYIGAGATILHGLTIGEGAIIGAGAVVVDNIPPYSVAVGVPAKVIKKISSI